jgi:hypothetical protein
MNKALDTVRKEACLIYYPVICLERLRKTAKKPSRDSRSSCRDLKQGLLEYEAGELTAEPRCSVLFVQPHAIETVKSIVATVCNLYQTADHIFPSSPYTFSGKKRDNICYVTP